MQHGPTLLSVKHNSIIMDLEETFKAYLRELIIPIVEEAMGKEAPEKEEEPKSEYITFKEIEKEYFITRQTVDRRFKNEKLTKLKDGGRVLFIRKEVDAMFKKRTMGGINTRKNGKRRKVA